MKLGENIFKLRKDLKLSQEQLAEKVDVTRQTISNWELGETSPNPEQLKLLSKTLNVSIDELLNNDIKSVMVEKISNTEKLVEIIIKILKGIGILFIVFLIATSILIFMFGAVKKEPAEESSQTIHLNCKLNDKEYSYLIEIDENGDIVEYTLKVTKEGFLESILIIIIGIGFLGGIGFLSFLLIKKTRKKK